MPKSKPPTYTLHTADNSAVVHEYRGLTLAQLQTHMKRTSEDLSLRVSAWADSGSDYHSFHEKDFADRSFYVTKVIV